MNLKYLIDENVKISPQDAMLFEESVITNSVDYYQHGTPDHILTKRAKKEGLIIVTKDIRMALRSLKDGVGVIFITNDGKEIDYLTVLNHDVSEYKEMHDYLYKRFKLKE